MTRRLSSLLTAGILAALGLSAATSSVVRYEDLPEALQRWLAARNIDRERFAAFVHEIDQRSLARVETGAREHLVYFILQSTRFTSLPRIEPAISAKTFIESGGRRVEAAVLRRFDAFLQARGSADDARFAYFARLIPDGSAKVKRAFLHAAYESTMKFLYEKEFIAARNEVPMLYRTRGLSTDTGFEANFPVDLALQVVRQLEPGVKLPRALIIGPGLDLAPRTDLMDVFPPQSFQPFAVADTLLRLGLADQERLKVHSVDVNEPVLRYLAQVRHGTITELMVFSEVQDSSDVSNEYLQYFRSFGREIGTPRPSPPPPFLRGRLSISLFIKPAIARTLSSERLNIITRRYRRDVTFDVVVATNVFPYFTDTELALALANIASSVRQGGYLIHNEGRPAVAELASAAGLAPVQVRGVLISDRILDSIWIHRKPASR